MAYEKHTWSCGETVTADLLNHMEDGIENADPGYSCTYTDETVIDETFTSEEKGAGISATLQSETNVTNIDIVVVYDGTRYTCRNQMPIPQNGRYGADYDGEEIIFTDYPFRFESTGNVNQIYTKTAGEHTIQIIVPMPSATYTECFKKAVQTVVEESGGGGGSTNEPLYVHFTVKDYRPFYYDVPGTEIEAALDSGRPVIGINHRAIGMTEKTFTATSINVRQFPDSESGEKTDIIFTFVEVRKPSDSAAPLWAIGEVMLQNIEVPVTDGVGYASTSGGAKIYPQS